MKVAVLSLDIEDWYHLDYFRKLACDRSQSLLDGVNVYFDILARYGIRSSCFVLGELIATLRSQLAEIVRQGHDLGVHGWDHARPLEMTREEFAQDLQKCKGTLEDAIGAPAIGYRAPCFSLDKDRLDIVKTAGFGYDTSRIQFRGHPLYGTLELPDYLEVGPNIFRKDSFFEFQVSTLTLLGREAPVSGGGYLRIFPWLLMRRLIQSYLNQGQLYVLYIHPYELSPRPTPRLPVGVSARSRLRFGIGRATVAEKFAALIELLQKNGYRFTTFAALRNELLLQPDEASSHG